MFTHAMYLVHTVCCRHLLLDYIVPLITVRRKISEVVPCRHFEEERHKGTGVTSCLHLSLTVIKGRNRAIVVSL